MNEFALIQQYFSGYDTGEFIRKGIGDDCAIVSVPAGYDLVFSVDALLSGVHFFEDSPPELIAERALRVCLSDLAAMGAEPLCFTLSLSLPEYDASWLASFSQGLLKQAQDFACPLVGGDTVRGPLCISIEVKGLVPAGTALLRSGAKVGDVIGLTGNVGSGAASLAHFKGELDLVDQKISYFRDSYYRPEPQLALGSILREYNASAAIDISDGLMADLQHICTSSQCGAEIEVDKLPIAHELMACVDQDLLYQWALMGGDDYQLCFTIAPSKVSALQDRIKKDGISLSFIGQITEKMGVTCHLKGEAIQVTNAGYQHF